MVDKWDNNLDDLNLTFETVGDIIILNVGKFYSMHDFLFMTTVAYGNRSTNPEWRLLYNPDQLIIDFNKFKGADQIGGEFFLLRENYEMIKGKEILTCGINKKDNFFSQALGGEFLKFKNFETREKAIEYYLAHKNK